MKLVERHRLKPSHPNYQEIDQWAFKSKNLYNQSNYVIRQHFFATREIISYPEMDKLMQSEEAYLALPRKVSQQVLRGVDRAWKSWSQAFIAYSKDPSLFLGKPKIPGYKDKQKGRNLLVYTRQALSQPALRKGLIKPSQLTLEISTKQVEVKEVRIVPSLDGYMVEVIYEKEARCCQLNQDSTAAIDIGLNNLAAVTSNQKGFNPILVNGRPLKSINQFYNKRKAFLQSCLTVGTKTSSQIRKLTAKRNRKIEDYLHKASRYVIDYLVAHQIGKLVIGKNPLWKQKVKLRRTGNQNFVSVPHHRFISMLTYKAQLVGMEVIIQEESYTSKASFLDLDPIPTYGKREDLPKLSGRRLKRGLYKSHSTGRIINSDVNGSLNILRKAAPSMFADGVEGVVVRPVKVTIPVG